MKFLHTADWQIGMKASVLGSAGERVRDERLVAGKRVVEEAKNRGVDFILVAGDTFEDNAVDRGLVQRVADILGAFGKPVFIIPGNHDPLVPGSVWEHPSWKSAINVHVLIEELPVNIPGGLLFPCPVREKHSGRNPIAWIPKERTGVIQIGLAHGTVEGVRQDEPDYPIPRDAAERVNLNYLALGHWHSYSLYPSENGVSTMAYSGTHETTKFGERDSGNVLIVEIGDSAAPPTITPVKTGSFDWMTITEEVLECGDLRALRERIESLENPSTRLVNVVVLGILTARERTETNHIEQILASRFLWGQLDASRLHPSPQDQTWVEDLPQGIIREAALRLRDNSDVAPEIAARALTELYSIAKETAR